MAFLWLVATLSLLIDIVGIFSLLSGGPNLFDCWPVIIQSFLSFASLGTLTEPGQTVMKNTLKNRIIPSYLREKDMFGAASLLLLIFVCLRLFLPRIAPVFSNAGFHDYEVGRLASAQSHYKKALALNPNDGRTHFYLGSLYEEFHDFNRARTEYQIALENGYYAAYNNLARLHILDKKYNEAAYLLRRLESNPSIKLSDNDIVNYNLNKNLGWTRLEQGLQAQNKTLKNVFLAEAEAKLNEAIDLAKKTQLSKTQQASAHCLLAHVLEEKEHDSKQVQEEWRYCLSNNPVKTPEEDVWKFEAKKRCLDETSILDGGGS